MAEEKEKTKPVLPDSIDIHYIKGNFFRIIQVDGGYGGITPRGLIHLDLFNERAPIPVVQKFRIDNEGNLSDEVIEDRISKQGLIREVEVGIVFNISTAKSIKKWLEDKISQLETEFVVSKKNESKDGVKDDEK